jgi:hypothetical protein
MLLSKSFAGSRETDFRFRSDKFYIDTPSICHRFYAYRFRTTDEDTSFLELNNLPVRFEELDNVSIL